MSRIQKQDYGKIALECLLSGSSAFFSKSLWVNGNTIYSYATPITWISAGRRVVMNMTKYSSTTSTYQNQIFKAILDANILNAKYVNDKKAYPEQKYCSLQHGDLVQLTTHS